VEREREREREMGCFSCVDSPAEEQLNPKVGGPYGGGSSSSAAAAAYGGGGGSGAGRHGERGGGYPDLHHHHQQQQLPMAAPRVEKLSAGASVTPSVRVGLSWGGSPGGGGGWWGSDPRRGDTDSVLPFPRLL
jgi:hypothetical protein